MLEQVARSRFRWVIVGQAAFVAVLITLIVTANTAWWLWLLLAVDVGVLAAAARERNRAQQRMRDIRTWVERTAGEVIPKVLKGPRVTSGSADAEQEVHRQLNEKVASTYASWRDRRRAKSLISPKEVQRRLRLHLQAEADEEIRSQAEKVILELQTPLPRVAKRLLNRLSFLVVVAQSRNMIGDGLVTPQQLGKWVVLQDQWPRAMRAITKDPQLVGKLEDVADQRDAFTTKCMGFTPPLAPDIEKLRKVFSAEPQIRKVAEHLVYLGANLKPPNTDLGPSTHEPADTA
jgi:hypothetical protein